MQCLRSKRLLLPFYWCLDPKLLSRADRCYTAPQDNTQANEIEYAVDPLPKWDVQVCSSTLFDVTGLLLHCAAPAAPGAAKGR